MSKSVSNPFLCRYAPNQRFLTGAFINQQETKIHPVNYGPSITDKEAYRLQLVNGVGASSFGAASNPACYMFPDGKYDISKDISYILRPDLSPVQIDMYLQSMKESLETSDEKLKAKIEKDIKYAEEIKARAAEEIKARAASDSESGSSKE